MLDSKTKAKIDEAIKILNDLNDNEKDLVISDINKKGYSSFSVGK
jgi:hypothetical protein